MKKLKAALYVFINIMFMPGLSFASEQPPPNGFDRIAWNIRCAKPMPKNLIVGLVLIAIVIIMAVIYVKMVSKK